MAIDPNEAAQAFMLLDQLLKNPDTRNDTLKLMKRQHPKAVIPELDAAAPYEKKFEELTKKIDDFITAQGNDRVDSKLLGKLDAIRSRHGLTDEGMEKLKQMMLDKSIADPEDAIHVFNASQPQPDPSMPTGYFPTSFIDESAKDNELWFQNEDQAADAEIMTILRETRAGRVH
jgi:hypothetical protein